MLDCRYRAPLVIFLGLTLALALQPSAVAGQGKTQKISKNLVKRAEDLIKDVDRTTKQVEDTVKRYDEIFEKRKVKDRQKALKDLGKEIENTEDRVKQVRKRVENMQKEADKFFDEWSKGLADITDAELRTLSRTTMTENRDRYAEIIESGLKAGQLYESFVADLEHQSSYLELDMSDTAIARLADSRAETESKARELFRSVDDLVKATKSYVASMK